MKPATKLSVRDYKTKEDVTRKYGFTYHSQCDCGEHFICAGNPEWSNPTSIGYYVHGSSIKSIATYVGVATAVLYQEGSFLFNPQISSLQECSYKKSICGNRPAELRRLGTNAIYWNVSKS
ncbi:hypothetical protein JUJ52_03175 [Virgibacillus sp. AGTR]|uniref:hypothetical protein n=1 Tax=Virgibacillus sp. AGTR TaxID=2812055 RepID=UPI001D16E13D|nr:hypothetical protein [Virgibacillus sp. AGTR]MCC2248960.1 hypothetical protein [Virgibacillus sp. AGTR]